MNVSLTPELEGLVNEKVESGLYENLADVGVIDRGHGHRLATQALARARIGGCLGRQELDRDLTIEPRVSGCATQVETHPSAAENLLLEQIQQGPPIASMAAWAAAPRSGAPTSIAAATRRRRPPRFFSISAGLDVFGMERPLSVEPQPSKCLAKPVEPHILLSTVAESRGPPGDVRPVVVLGPEWRQPDAARRQLDLRPAKIFDVAHDPTENQPTERIQS